MSRAEAIARRLGAARRSGRDWLCLCPAHDDRKPSLSVSDAEDGRVLAYCHAGCGQREVIAALDQLGIELGSGGGVPTSSLSTQAAANWEAILPVPAGVALPTIRGATHCWIYFDSRGRVLFLVARYDDADGGKRFLPFTYGKLNGEAGWQNRHPRKPRPLYGLDKLALRPTTDVLVVEGEKAADAAQRLQSLYSVITWPGGANAVKQADWSPLRGHRVLIWPDRDRQTYPTGHKKAGLEKPDHEQPGMKAGKSPQAHCEASSMDRRAPLDVPDGWDQPLMSGRAAVRDC